MTFPLSAVLMISLSVPSMLTASLRNVTLTVALTPPTNWEARPQVRATSGLPQFDTAPRRKGTRPPWSCGPRSPESTPLWGGPAAPSQSSLRRRWPAR
jgi:hypothetical protein